MLDQYRDPLFLLFPVYTALLSVAAFLAFALPWSLIVWMDPGALRPYRIQSRRHPPSMVFWPSLARLAVNSLFTFAVVAALWPVLRRSGIHAGPLPPWHEMAWQLPLFLIVDDTLFYFLHRALHTRWLYARVHAVHHRLTAPWAVAGGYFHPVEYALIAGVALVGPILVGAHVMTLWIWTVARQWEAAEGHSGYELPWNPTRLLPGYEGPAFHDFHHAKFRGNYANFFGILDRWLGTESPGYRAFREGRGHARSSVA